MSDKPQKRDKSKDAVTAVKAAGSAIPVLLGGNKWSAAISLAALFATNAIENSFGAKRSEELGHMIEDALENSEMRARLDDKVDEDSFFGMVIRANDAARKSSSEEKLRYIRNFVLNARSVPLSSDRDLERYLRLIEDLTFRELEHLVEFCRRTCVSGGHPNLDDYAFSTQPGKLGMMLGTYVRQLHGIPEGNSSPKATDLELDLMSVFRHLESAGLLDGVGAGGLGDVYLYNTTPFTPRFLRFILTPEPIRRGNETS